MLMTVIIFIITLLILVVIHELGHFLMAKRFNIKVLEFGFGIPPRAWGKKVGDTLVSVNWLPFGGFVHLLGEDEEGEEKKKNLKDWNKRSFSTQNVWKRISVVVAGVVMNLLLAWFLFYIILGSTGFKTELPLIEQHQFVGVNQRNENMVLVSEVVSGSPADNAGIKAGDKVVTINDEFVDSSQELIDKTKSLAGPEIKLVLTNETKEFKGVTVIPRQNPPEGQGPLGVGLVSFELANLSYETPMQKVFSGPIHSWNLTAYSGKILGSLIASSIKEKKLEPISHAVAGPVGITSVANTILTSTDEPLIPYLNFMAVLSLNLAVLNLFPFPALDGGRLFFLLIEAVVGKRINPKIERWVHSVGMAILLTLILLITFSDIRKLFV